MSDIILQILYVRYYLYLDAFNLTIRPDLLPFPRTELSSVQTMSNLLMNTTNGNVTVFNTILPNIHTNKIMQMDDSGTRFFSLKLCSVCTVYQILNSKRHKFSKLRILFPNIIYPPPPGKSKFYHCRSFNFDLFYLTRFKQRSMLWMENCLH